MKSLQDRIEESVEDFFEEHFATYDMTKYRALLIEWLKYDGYEICPIIKDIS